LTSLMADFCSNLKGFSCLNLYSWLMKPVGIVVRSRHEIKLTVGLVIAKLHPVGVITLRLTGPHVASQRRLTRLTRRGRCPEQPPILTSPRMVGQRRSTLGPAQSKHRLRIPIATHFAEVLGRPLEFPTYSTAQKL
jgi:hypothetical protein